MTRRRIRFTRRATSRGLLVVSALGITLAIVSATAGTAAASSNDGSDWGSQGVTQSDSATTVSWSNVGNAADDTVSRDAKQVLPYTGGKTFADSDASYDALVKKNFSGMKLTVSKTKDLVHQGVQLTLTGVDGGAGASSTTGSRVDVMECWGGTTVDGKPDTTQPDPTHCQTGPGGVDPVYAGQVPQPNGGIQGQVDAALVAGGDLKATPNVALVVTGSGDSTALAASVVLPQGLATGAAGTMEFDGPDGKSIATNVAVVKGIATLPVKSTSTSTAYTAVYHAAPAENFTDSIASTAATVPVPPTAWSGYNSVLPGTSGVRVFPAGTFAASSAITLKVDKAAAVAAGTSQADGGYTLNYTVPTSFQGGSQHTLVVSDGTASQSTTLAIRFPAGPMASVGSNAAPNNLTATFPFTSVGGTSGSPTSFFTSVTTNEFTSFNAASTVGGTVSRTFEMQTGAESSGLGCGATTQSPSTSTCWLVAVPAPPSNTAGSLPQSPLSPSQWANRVQVKLSFADVQSTCSGSQSRVLASGTELLSLAVASWTPAICNSANVSLGYSVVGDPVARSQYTSNEQSLVFTSNPIDDSAGGTSTVYAPVALTGVTVGLRAYDGDTRVPITDIKLDARLIARLLTESYGSAIDTNQGTQVGTNAPWVSKLVPNLLSDPEFVKLNPKLPANTQIGTDLILSSTLSDPVDVLWRWLTNDKDARAFLDGCDGTINPWYSTRSYAECTGQKVTLEKKAAAQRAATITPKDFNRDAAPVYPPTDVTFPQPGWYERTATATQLPLSISNLHPREASLAGVNTDIFTGIEHSVSSWCPASDNSCTQNQPGQLGYYIDDQKKALINTVLGVTDTSAAALDQTTTASLCDDSGACVSANSASLTKAIGILTPTSNPAVVTEPASAGDSIASGAYPLTLPVYAEVNTQGLVAADAQGIAKILTYAAGTGQTAGFGSGQLPPGYAPLPASMVAQTKATVTTLEAITDPAATDDGTAAASGDDVSPSTSDDFGSDTSALGSEDAPLSADAPAESAAGVATDPAVADPVLVSSIGKTPFIPAGFPTFGIWSGLGAAVVSAVVAFIIGRPRGKRI